MRAGIDLISRKLADSPFSHQASWAWLRACQLRATGKNIEVIDQIPRGERTWVGFDEIYIYHGMDYVPDSGNLNIFDGLVEYSAKSFGRLAFPEHAKIKYYSLACPMPDYGAMCKARGGKVSDYWAKVDWDAVSARCQNVEWILDPVYQQEGRSSCHLVIGDSHAHSVYKSPSAIIRKDGRTMAGIIKKTVKKEIEDYGFDLKRISSLTCYWGSIDIRHHLYRDGYPNHLTLTRDLVRAYAEELKTLELPIELVTPLPIEHESRKIPKTGYFKGTPFYGKREDRVEILNMFIDELNNVAAKNGWTVFSWPKDWYDGDGMEFMQKYMERPRSVHLARKFYRWNLAEDRKNELLETKKLLSF